MKTLISIIVAMAKNNVIGKNNDMPWGYLPEDLKYFKQITLNKNIIMGRKTFESIGKPLPNRLNIIISKTMSKKTNNDKNVIIVSSLKEALSLNKNNKEEEIFIIGGGQIYKEAIENNIIDNFYISFIEAEFKGDTFFPSINHLKLKKEYEQFFEKDERNKYNIKFTKYNNLKN
jgi:dihydrofolate reductase